MEYSQIRKQDQEEKKRVMDIRKEQITKDLFDELEKRLYNPSKDLKEVDGVLTGFGLVYEYEATHINRDVTGCLRMKMQDHNYHMKNYREPKKGFVLLTSVLRIIHIVEESKKRSREIKKKQARKEKETKFFLSCCESVGIKTNKYTLEKDWTYINNTQLYLKRYDSKHVEISLNVTQDQLINIFEILKKR